MRNPHSPRFIAAINRASQFAGEEGPYWNERFRMAATIEGILMIEDAVKPPPGIGALDWMRAPLAWHEGAGGWPRRTILIWPA